MSPIARILLGAIRAYQMFFSAWMPSACKFYPSCSQYAANAVQLHGARRGSWLALVRLTHCHPFTRGGVDLVPDVEESRCDGNADAPTLVFENHGDARAGSTCSFPESEVRP